MFRVIFRATRRPPFVCTLPVHPGIWATIDFTSKEVATNFLELRKYISELEAHKRAHVRSVLGRTARKARALASELTRSPRALERCRSAGLELLERRRGCQSSACALRDVRRALSAYGWALL